MADVTSISAFDFIWNFWWSLLYALNKGVSHEDTLPVTVAIFAFVILFYIAFRYFLFARLLKDRVEDSTVNKFSIVMAIAFTVLGTYLGWIPVAAEFFGALYMVIALVFIIILFWAFIGMTKASYGAYREVSGEAAEARGRGREMEARGRAAEVTANRQLADIDNMEKNAQDMAVLVHNIEKDNKNRLDRYRQLIQLIDKAQHDVNSPVVARQNVLHLDNALNAIRELTPATSKTIFDELAAKQKLFDKMAKDLKLKRKGVHFPQGKNLLLKELKKQLTLAEGIHAATPRQKYQDIINQLNTDIPLLTKLVDYETYAYSEFKKTYDKKLKAKYKQFKELKIAIESYSKAAEKDNVAAMQSALKRARLSADNIVKIYESMQNNTSKIVDIELGYRTKIDDIKTRWAANTKTLSRLPGGAAAPAGAAAAAAGAAPAGLIVIMTPNVKAALRDVIAEKGTVVDEPTMNGKRYIKRIYSFLMKNPDYLVKAKVRLASNDTVVNLYETFKKALLISSPVADANTAITTVLIPILRKGLKKV